MFFRHALLAFPYATLCKFHEVPYNPLPHWCLRDPTWAEEHRNGGIEATDAAKTSICVVFKLITKL